MTSLLFFISAYTLGVTIIRSQGHCIGLCACVLAHDAIHIAVNLGDHFFAILPGESSSGGELLRRFVGVQLIDSEREGAVAIQRQALRRGAQTLYSAVAAPVVARGAGSAVVVHLGSGHLVDAHSVCAVPCKVLIRHHAELRLGGKLFINIREKLLHKINTQVLLYLRSALNASPILSSLSRLPTS